MQKESPPTVENFIAARAAFEVNAGVIPMEPMPEYRKTFFYSSMDYEQDTKTPKDQPTIYSKLSEQAHDYARSIENPQYVNWVQVTFIWY